MEKLLVHHKSQQILIIRKKTIAKLTGAGGEGATSIKKNIEDTVIQTITGPYPFR